MKKILLMIGLLAGIFSLPAFAINMQPGFDSGNLPASQVTPDCTQWSKNLSCSDNNQQAVDNVLDQLSGGGGSGLTVGTTTIANGTNGYVEYNNNGVLGEEAVAGTDTYTIFMNIMNNQGGQQ